MALVVYVLRVNNEIYVIDSSYIICDSQSGGGVSREFYLCVPCKDETSYISAELRKFPNTDTNITS